MPLQSLACTARLSAGAAGRADGRRRGPGLHPASPPRAKGVECKTGASVRCGGATGGAPPAAWARGFYTPTTLCAHILSASGAPRAQTVLGIILGGGAGSRLYPLTKKRAKPAVPLGANYRLIDIPVSNCINSNVNKIYCLTQARRRAAAPRAGRPCAGSSARAPTRCCATACFPDPLLDRRRHS
jgi:hypothetical protein